MHHIDSLLPAARSLAVELFYSNVDINEAQKTLAYLRKADNAQQFFSYLQTTNQHGGVVIRSAKTRGYYRDLLAACDRHLRGMSPGDMALTLGWAVRLLRYYKTQPPDLPPPGKRRAAPPRDTRQAAPPPGKRRAAPPRDSEPAPPSEVEAVTIPVKPKVSARPVEVGDRFRGKIVQVKRSGHVFLELPDEVRDATGKVFASTAEQRKQADVVIPAESHSGSGIKVGNARWVEVVGIHQQSDKLLIEVKPSQSPISPEKQERDS
jgi:hypothetical protein